MEQELRFGLDLGQLRAIFEAIFFMFSWAKKNDNQKHCSSALKSRIKLRNYYFFFNFFFLLAKKHFQLCLALPREFSVMTLVDI